LEPRSDLARTDLGTEIRVLAVQVGAKIDAIDLRNGVLSDD
jgi:hypothetical protein